MLNALIAEIGDTLFHLGKIGAVLGFEPHLPVHQRHDHIVMAMPMPARVGPRRKAVFGDNHLLILDMDDGFGASGHEDSPISHHVDGELAFPASMLYYN